MKDIFIVLEDKKSNPIREKYNWAKLRILQQVLCQFFRFNKQDCKLEEDIALQHSLFHLFIKSEQELDEMTSSKNIKQS